MIPDLLLSRSPALSEPPCVRNDSLRLKHRPLPGEENDFPSCPFRAAHEQLEVPRAPPCGKASQVQRLDTWGPGAFPIPARWVGGSGYKHLRAGEKDLYLGASHQAEPPGYLKTVYLRD